MRKYINVLEVPFYLLVIAFCCFNNGDVGTALFLLLVSVGRLIINSITQK